VNDPWAAGAARVLPAAAALIVGIAAPAAFGAAAPGEWPAFGRDPGGSQYSPLRQIDARNVAQLEVAWVHRSGDFVDAPLPEGTVFQSTPIHVNGSLYFCTPLNRVFALDPATGRERWVFDPYAVEPRTGKATSDSPKRPSRCRGVAYWEEGAVLPAAAPVAAAAAGARPSATAAASAVMSVAAQNGAAVCRKRLFKNHGAGQVIALDADTGKPCLDFGAAKGHAGWASHNDYEGHGEGFVGSASSPPVVLRDVVISATAVNDGIRNAKDGIVRAFDVRTGELRWEFNPIPDDKRALSGAANVWSTFSVDVERNLVFLPTTSPSTDYFGGGRPFEIPLANAIVALDGATGRVLWSHQTVRHDLFDYDLVGHPLLVDVRRNGQTIPAALLQTKMGWLFGFDRTTGAPLWPIVEMPVPKTDVPGDVAAPTQPVPQGVAPFARQRLDRDHLFGLTPFDRAACRSRFDEARYEGMYTPPSMRGSILFPSALGGGNWGGAAFDAASNTLYIKAENLATLIRVVRKEGPDKDMPVRDYLTRPLVGTDYRVEGELFMSPLGIPCTPPPWGTLSAIDLGTGKLKWQIPLGQVRKWGINAPASFGWGSPNVGGPIVTAGGLIFIGATMDSKFRALDPASGRELWSADLPAPGMALPMTYLAGGRQFVAIAAGGNAQVGTKIGDSIVAFALPGTRIAQHRTGDRR
jgi:quinoprotein glucose dehydrogenase